MLYKTYLTDKEKDMLISYALNKIQNDSRTLIEYAINDMLKEVYELETIEKILATNIKRMSKYANND